LETVSPIAEIITEVRKAGGISASVCYQCGKCDVVCPWNRVRAFSIRKIVRQAALGVPEIESEDLWRCTTCGSCQAACPRGVRQIPVGVSLRRIAHEYGVLPESARGVRSAAASLATDGNPISGARAERAERGAEVAPAAQAADKVVRDLVVALEDASRRLPDAAVQRPEPHAPFVERLVELAVQMRILPDLGLGQPLAAQPVEPCPLVLEQQVERVVALEVAFETQAEAQVIRSPLLLARRDHHHAGSPGLPDDVVIDSLEIAGAVDAAQVLADLLLGERLARLGLDQPAQHLGIGALQTFEANFVHGSQGNALPDLPRAKRRVLLGRDAVARELQAGRRRQHDDRRVAAVPGRAA